jgi:anthranilate phosphoribosyltransferase
MKAHIEKCLAGEHLTVDEASDALGTIMTGQATDAQIAGLLVALRAKGETVNEVVGFARTMRTYAVRLAIDDPDAIDMCGTGGDGLSTFNISTVASFVAAGAGVTIAKHGNRSVSSRSGSADVLTALGVNVNCPIDTVQACINGIGIGFLFAPLFHPAMKYAARTRSELGVRSIFNMLGPLTNPAGVKRQLVGVYRGDIAGMCASALQELGAERACVVHSEDGMDEVTLSGETLVHEVNAPGEHKAYRIGPEDFGLAKGSLDHFRGGDAAANAAIAVEILNDGTGPARDVVVANAALGIFVAGKTQTLADGTVRAQESIRSGSALRKLQQLVAYTNRT